MNKFRWTIGDTSKIGIEILRESIIKVKKFLSDFELYVCFNGEKNFIKLKQICEIYDVKLIIQDWDLNFPLPKTIIPAISEKQCILDLMNESGIPRGRQGSFWKLCPPRIFIDDYEIVCDNDVVIQSRPQEIDDFLIGNSPIVVQEDAMALGKYFKYVNKPYNSGFYGFPPKFDFEKLLIDKWIETGSMHPLLSRDEQGLIIATLKQFDCIEIPSLKVSHIFNEGKAKNIEFEEVNEMGNISKIISNIEFEKPNIENKIIHFLGSNRRIFHNYWHQYKRKNLKVI